MFASPTGYMLTSFGFSYINLRYITLNCFIVIANSHEVLMNFNRLFLNSTGSFVTNCRFSLVIGKKANNNVDEVCPHPTIGGPNESVNYSTPLYHPYNGYGGTRTPRNTFQNSGTFFKLLPVNSWYLFFLRFCFCFVLFLFFFALKLKTCMWLLDAASQRLVKW